MYCMNCGVKLGEGEEKCPLCGLRAYHPDLERTPGPSLYPREWHAPEAERSSWRYLLTVFFIVAVSACLLVDLLLEDSVTWSGFVLAGLLTGYVLLVLPLWFARPNVVVFLGIDFTAVGLMLLYIDLAVQGGWFLSLAFPVTAMYGALVTGFAAIVKYVRRGRFFQLGGGCIVFGCSAMLLELFICITFGTGMFTWSLYPVAILSAVGLFWILAGLIRPLGDAIRKKTFL
ncbi:MAG: DUF6320 domain-containing protein [Faecousia sp.]